MSDLELADMRHVGSISSHCVTRKPRSQTHRQGGVYMDSIIHGSLYLCNYVYVFSTALFIINYVKTIHVLYFYYILPVICKNTCTSTFIYDFLIIKNKLSL